MATPGMTAAPTLPESLVTETTASESTPPKTLASVEIVPDHESKSRSGHGIVDTNDLSPHPTKQAAEDDGHTADDESRDSGSESDSENNTDGKNDLENVDNEEPRDPQTSKRQDTPILEQVKALQQQLFELERQTRPKLSTKALEAEWERELDTVGPEPELRRWSEEKRRRQVALLMENASYVEGKQWFHKVDAELGQKIAEELKYNSKLLKLRGEWERKQKLTQSMIQLKHRGEVKKSRGEVKRSSDEDSDEDSSDFSSDYDWHRHVLRRNFEFDREALELRYELKRRHQRTRRLRERERELERERDRIQHEVRRKESLSVPEHPIATKVAVIEEPVIPSATSKVDRVEWTQFKALGAQPERLSSAIDVLIGEPIIEFGGSGLYRNFRAPQKAQKADKVLEKRTPLPERLRIHSRQIIQILGKIHGSELSVNGSIVLIRPFKVLIHYEQALRDWNKKLENKFIENERPEGSAPLITITASSEAVKVADRSVAKPVETNMTAPCTDREAGTESGTDDKKRSNSEPQQEAEDQNIQTEQEDKDSDDDTSSPIAFQHLKLLLEFMDKDMSQRIDYLKSPKCQKVVFSDLWFLFRPGGHVIGNDGKQAYRILSVESIGHKVIDPIRKWYDKSLAKEEETPITIKCVFLDFDGKQLGPVSTTFEIKRFDREKAVTSLDIYPLRFHPFLKSEPQNADATNEKPTAPGDLLWKYLLERGKTFLKVSVVDLARIQPMYYAGPALATTDETENKVVVDFESQVVVDFEAAFAQTDWRPNLETLIGTSQEEEDKENKMCDAECCLGESVYNDSYVEQKRNEEFMGRLLPKSREEMPSVVIFPQPLDTKAPETGLTDDDLVIMSYRVFGFVLRNRKWAQLDLTYLTDDQLSSSKNLDSDGKEDNAEKKTAFDRLVLPDGHKKMILSLITQHFRDKEPNKSRSDYADIVRGKGKGLIILLHGAPGVGKTTTAEGVAEKFKKPLFQLTCGDLGTTAQSVEDVLERNFALANRWGCVLLLDEADVFLAQRTKEDFKRNGLVAVFLRILEYYAGILFLTTNRVGDFDEAFASRIHMSLYYPELDRKKTLDVFKLNIQLIDDRFRGEARKFKPDEMEIGAFAQEFYDNHPFDHWNGRQIRNVCQTALALAENEAQQKDPSAAPNQNADIELNVSHFKIVADAYLEFSTYVREIYGTHAARRAKEAGLRAIWVDENGKEMGNVGPKEASILKHEKKARFKQRAQQVSHTTPIPQTYPSQEGNQGYDPRRAQSRPSGPPYDYYDNGPPPQPGYRPTNHPHQVQPTRQPLTRVQGTTSTVTRSGYRDAAEEGQYLKQGAQLQVPSRGRPQQKRNRLPGSTLEYGMPEPENETHTLEEDGYYQPEYQEQYQHSDGGQGQIRDRDQ